MLRHKAGYSGAREADHCATLTTTAGPLGRDFGFSIGDVDL
ncbi:hypothetical protein SBA5_10083 [Candidatus Sulfotelmatomonas gaucii]|uniref:Uncharacterized protein n=1 Tax=Candidatus Sulfuritelmatomonas gaucii TaxID=2043161 RepID=A0A2N9L241_9BACT|nr:hypothetical protein SBA5_10083 [Candidatus Sulfotelmatomonas gaucii]